MDRDIYEITAHQVFLIGRLTANLDLAGLLNAINHAETVAPFTDPTLYQRYLYGGGREVNAALTAIAHDLLRVQATVRKHTPVVAEVIRERLAKEVE